MYICMNVCTLHVCNTRHVTHTGVIVILYAHNYLSLGE